MSNLPIWAKPPPGSRKPRFTRDQIAAAALKIADEEGFDALSMRRIADELGAGTMTLYYYVRTKDDLLALMDDALMAEVVHRTTPLPKHWRTALETIARATRETFLRHSWALHALEEARMGGPNGLIHMEHSLSAVAQLPVPQSVRFDLLSIVDDFVFGSVLRNRHDGKDNQLDAAGAKALNDLTKEYLAAGAYPHLVTLLAGREPIDAFIALSTELTEHSRFERGLALLLDGFAAKYDLTRRAGDERKPARKPRIKR